MLLLERESLLCAHSSGRNAAIFLALAQGPAEVELARRSRPYLDPLLPGWLERAGTLMLADHPARVEAEERRAAREGVRCRKLDAAQLIRAAPALEGGSSTAGLFFPDDGVMDISALTESLARTARSAGGRIRCEAEVERVEALGERVVGVRLVSGERLAAGAVVICGGAWAEKLGATCGAALPLGPLRRHLAVLEVGPRLTAPVVWSVDHEVYFRPESGGVLASPCDEEPWPPGLPPTSTAGLEALAEKLTQVAPGLAQGAVRRAWACLRTFAPDRAAVVGADPRLRGLYWLAGLGGHGMTGALAAGEVLAAAVAQTPHPLAPILSPSRLTGD